MAGGWAPDGAEQAQIDANLDDALAAARQNLPSGESARECAECGEPIPEARRRALNGGAAPREAREDPGDDEVERGEDTDRLPVDLLAIVGQQPSCGEEDEDSQEIDGQ